jgi:hypothetical protein
MILRWMMVNASNIHNTKPYYNFQLDFELNEDKEEEIDG